MEDKDIRDKALSMIGFKNSLLTVIRRGPTKKGRAYWACRCECGNTTIVSGQQLRRDKTKSCGCLVSKLSIKNICGKKYGRLSVEKMVNERTHKGQIRWFCRCECGATVIVSGVDLRSGNTKSCGCYNRDNHTKHGYSIANKIAPEYKSWASMKDRCGNPKNPSHHRYGGRSIKVCERWQKFKNFLEDMGHRPVGTTLDRINNNGNYEPANCRWATKKEQQQNQYRNRLITFNGETLCLSAWAEKIGVDKSTLHYRIENWPLEKALTKTVKRQGGKNVYDI